MRAFPHFSIMNERTYPQRPAPHRISEVPQRPEIEAEIRRLEQLARLMDARFRIPGTSMRFGLDGLIGLIPGVGDAATLLPALYLIIRARSLGVPAQLQARMAGNVALDLLIGLVPLLGDLADFGFKANLRNIRLLREHFGPPPTTNTPF